MESIAAVVICPLPACRSAAIAPHSSASFKMTPPWIVPFGLACPGSVMIARLTREAEAGLAGIASLVMNTLLFSPTSLSRTVTAGLPGEPSP